MLCFGHVNQKLKLEDSSNYFQTTSSLWFYSKGEETNFDADIGDNNKLKSFEYEAKIFENTVADSNNSISKHSTIAVKVKHLTNHWRMLEMSLISCKIVLKCKWKRKFVLAAAGVDHVNVNDDNISFTRKDT